MSVASQKRRRRVRSQCRVAGIPWAEHQASALTFSWRDAGCGYTQDDYDQMVREDQDACREYDRIVARDRGGL